MLVPLCLINTLESICSISKASTAWHQFYNREKYHLNKKYVFQTFKHNYMHSHIISETLKAFSNYFFFTSHHFSNGFYTLRLQKQYPHFQNTFLIKKFVLTKKKYKSENKRKKNSFKEKDRKIDPITLVLTSRRIKFTMNFSKLEHKSTSHFRMIYSWIIKQRFSNHLIYYHCRVSCRSQSLSLSLISA